VIPLLDAAISAFEGGADQDQAAVGRPGLTKIWLLCRDESLIGARSAVFARVDPPMQ